MFRKSSTNKQLDLFSTPSNYLSVKDRTFLEDPKAWHNEFYQKVTCNIDEEKLRPLYKDSSLGAPTKNIRTIIAMRILKEGYGISDSMLEEQLRFSLVWRRALGLLNLDDVSPSIDSYYLLFRRISEYEEQTGINLYKEIYQDITSKQIRHYGISGNMVRMDSKLIGSNIAWFSRYEIIHETYCKSVSELEASLIQDQMCRQMAEDFLEEDAAKTVYNSNDKTLASKMLNLGIVINRILSMCPEDEKPLLRRVFGEQYQVAEDGTVSVRDKRAISANSVQNPNDPDATYRRKGNQKVKGNSTNITETCGEEGKPSLITDVQVGPSTTADNSFWKDAIEETQKVTGNKVEKAIADGAYQSEANRELASDEENGFELICSGLQGKPSRYAYSLQDDGSLLVTDKTTGETITAIKVKPDKWKIPVKDRNGRQVYKYIDMKMVNSCEVRKKMESIPIEDRKMRNNVEAAMFQYSYHTRNNKTRYRGLFKQTLQALARCAWINMRRLFIFDMNLALQS